MTCKKDLQALILLYVTYLCMSPCFLRPSTWGHWPLASPKCNNFTEYSWLKFEPSYMRRPNFNHSNIFSVKLIPCGWNLCLSYHQAQHSDNQEWFGYHYNQFIPCFFLCFPPFKIFNFFSLVSKYSSGYSFKVTRQGREDTKADCWTELRAW